MTALRRLRGALLRAVILRPQASVMGELAPAWSWTAHLHRPPGLHAATVSADHPQDWTAVLASKGLTQIDPAAVTVDWRTLPAETVWECELPLHAALPDGHAFVSNQVVAYTPGCGIRGQRFAVGLDVYVGAARAAGATITTIATPQPDHQESCHVHPAS